MDESNAKIWLDDSPRSTMKLTPEREKALREARSVLGRVRLELWFTQQDLGAVRGELEANILAWPQGQ
ncbi:MAG TPA: hypothetical protein VGF33_03090 [Caulobacteraceae bacterium]|jgi:hypothetical protein